MAVDIRNAANNVVDFAVFPATYSITFASMKDAKHNDSVITLEYFPAACGFITPANEMSFPHCLFSLIYWSR
jgi:hypothetical protein